MRVLQIFMCVLVASVLSSVANAAAPSTTCPTGYIAVVDKYVVLSGAACTNFYKATSSNIPSCLSGTSHGAKCWMYAPANMDFTDDTGTYQFTTACPLT